MIVLNPDYYLKNDQERSCIYSKSRCIHGGRENWSSFIHPVQAAILSFFSHQKDLDTCLLELASFLKLDLLVVREMINPFISNTTPIWTNFGDKKILFPERVLISVDNPINIRNGIRFDELFCEKVDLNIDRYLRAPHSATLMLNNTCLTDCKYCYADRKTKFESLSTENIFEIIENARRLRMKAINLIGGEVFLHRDWKCIIKKLVEYNMSPEYLSTKLPITDGILDAILDTGYKAVIQVSLDSVFRSSLSDVIGVAEGYLEKLMNGIRLLDSTGSSIQVNTILTNRTCNRDEIDRLYDFLLSIKNLDYWEIRVPNKPLPQNKGFDLIRPEREALLQAYAYIERYIKPNSPFPIISSSSALEKTYRSVSCESTTFDGGLCGALHSFIFILPDGKVTICEELYWHPEFIIGDLTKQTIEEIWNSEKASRLRELASLKPLLKEQCRSCSEIDPCIRNHKRCWTKIIRAYGNSNWNYPDPRCVRAPYTEELYVSSL